MARRIAGRTVNLLWGLAGGHCELCGKSVTSGLLAGRQGKFAQVAHIEADAPGGPRYNENQTDDERNSIENLMLVCPDCHKLIDDNAADYGVDYLRSRKQSYEASVRKAVDAIGPTRTDVITLAMSVGSDDFTISEKDWKKALVDAGVNVGDVFAFDASKNVPNGCGADTLWALKDRIVKYSELIHEGDAKHTSVFAIAPQPVLIGLGTMLADDGNVDVYQKRRDADGWSWASKGKANKFYLKERTPGRSEDCVIVVSISGRIDDDTFDAALPACVETSYTLDASRMGSTAIMLKDDWHAFKSAATEAIFEIHENHPEVKRLHVIPAMPVSACVAFGMAWNERLVPELVIYEKADGVFNRALSIGGSSGFTE